MRRQNIVVSTAVLASIAATVVWGEFHPSATPVDRSIYGQCTYTSDHIVDSDTRVVLEARLQYMTADGIWHPCPIATPVGSG